MRTTKIGDYFYFVVPKGTKIEIPNPEWDGDVPESEFNVKVVLLEDITVCTTGAYHEVLILDEKP